MGVKTLIILVLLFLSYVTKAQNQFHLSQYMVHQPLINPGSVGAFENLNGAIFHRNQWRGFEGAPKVTGFNINSPIGYQKKNNLGLTVFNDDIGVNNVTDVSLNYGYTVKTSLLSKLTFGLSGSLKMSQSNFADVETLGVVDPTFQSNTPTLLSPNFKFGTYFNARRFYLGFAIPNILHNEISNTSGITTFDFNQMHFYLHSGYKFKLNNNLDLNFSTLIKQIGGAPVQSDLNFLVDFKKTVGIGFSYRTSNEIATLVQLKITNFLRLAYSYDYTLNNLGNYSNGSHEIMLVFDFKNDSKPLIIEAPRF